MPVPDDLPIYPIRTVAQLSGVDPRRLRSWESEYQLLCPARSKGGHRLYSARDLQTIQLVRRLVDEEGMSLQGIRGYLAARPESSPAQPAPSDRKPEARSEARGDATPSPMRRVAAARG